MNFILVAFFIVSRSVMGSSLESKEQLKNYRVECENKKVGSCLRVAIELDKMGLNDEAAAFYVLACDGGDWQSCVHLGRFYAKQKEIPLAIRYFRRACENPNDKGESCFEIAALASEKNSQINALHWNDKACKKGFNKACAEK